jgi:hypothetical protein
MKFKFLTGDVNWKKYGGKFVSKKLNNGEFDFYLVMDVLSWEDVEPSAVKTHGKYCVSLYSVSPSEAGTDGLKSAYDSCGFTGEEDFLKNPLAQVDVLVSYGTYTQISSKSGNNLLELMRECRKEADAVNGLYGFYMDRPVNRIGTSGWEAQQGNILAGLNRKLMA